MKGRQSGNQAMLGWVEIDGMDGIKGPHTQATGFESLVGQNQGKIQKTSIYQSPLQLAMWWTRIFGGSGWV